MPRTVQAVRYLTPLREGGSLPAVVEADDDGTYVLKFRGAGQGPKALVAELIAGGVGRALGLPVPEIVLMELDPVLGRSEPDFEIKALLEASAGLNLAMDFLPGSLAYEPVASPRPDPVLAAGIVWFDAYLANVDRTARNTNILVWHKRLWLIDHGAALYYHHRWDDLPTRSRDPFPPIRNHVLLPYAGSLAAADAALRPLLSTAVLTAIIAGVPADWLDGGEAGAAAARQTYVEFLRDRLAHSEVFVQEAERARAALV
ncbi:MAG: HipA family kinase [Chloroflexota bacterium]